MSVAETGGSQIPEQLVEQLVDGYDALAVETKRVHEQHLELKNKLSWAKQQYLDVLKRFTPESASKDFRDFLGELDEAGACEKEGESDWLTQLSKSQDEGKRARAFHIQTSEDARGKISFRRKSMDLANGVRIWAGKSADLGDLERDFTTPGTPGGLGCPFAGSKLIAPTNGYHRGASTPRSSLSKLSLGRRSRKASFHDPIRAEECVGSPMSPDKSVAGSMPLCPIRFLDQHSPEEVARYFEKHQHEVPRSHEFCVKRFQENEEVVQNLNTKYANIVSMVQGLSAVHSSLLPNPEEIAVEDEEDIDEELVNTSTSKVEKWAQAVSNEGAEEDAAADQEDRETRFERSLKDVRVGESPSRPWGIPVPEEFEANGQAPSKISDATASPLEATSPHSAAKLPPMRCPFSGAKASNEAGTNTAHPMPHKIAEPEAPAPVPVPASSTTPHYVPDPGSLKQGALGPSPQMVFNGPVFFGYSFDQAMAMLKQPGLAP